MDMKERVIGMVSLTLLVGMGMLLGWAFVGTHFWWVAALFLGLSPITFLLLTRDD